MMSLTLSHKEEIKKILIISLSNIGDVILTFPVIDILKHHFPKAYFKIVVGPKAEALFKNNPHFERVEVFDKHQSFLKTVAWMLLLRKEKFDLVVDLRNTAFPAFIAPRHRTSLFSNSSLKTHRRERHLNRLKGLLDFPLESNQRYGIFLSKEDESFVGRLLQDAVGGGPFIAIAPGAANDTKRWTEKGFAELADKLISDFDVKIIFVGDSHDKTVSSAIIKNMKGKALDACGQTTLPQLAALLSKAKCVVSNDSAVMHMASYLDIPVAAIFGPTDFEKYGPWGSKKKIVYKNIFCSPCEKSGCAYAHECMEFIKSMDVFAAVSSLLKNN